MGIENGYRGRRVCVTGGAGFIGSHLCETLVKLGADVAVIDDLSSATFDNLEPIKGHVRFVHGSILDATALEQATRDAELIFHEAALTSVPASVEQPQRYHEVNATGTLCVLEAARRGSGKVRVINASSSSVYGGRAGEPLEESLAPQPRSPYAAAKCAAECMVRAYAACYGIAAISLRYFNIFGPRQRPDSPYAAAIPRFAQAMLQGNRPTVYGDGTQTRDFTHVANAVGANLLAGVSTRELAGQAVNVACGRSCTVLELLEMMAAILGIEPAYELAPARPGDVLHSAADLARASELLGYEPVMSLEEGLADAIEYYSRLLAPSGT